jgi:hypothetical protein
VSVPDAESEIRATALRNVQGANFWSRRPVTRMDLAVGAYEDISSAHASGFNDRLQRAMPGLIEHRCSIGKRGGFLTRLERGTYAPHIIEHVALELQVLIGHEVGYGKTRGGDAPGEYTLVFEHRHPAVGLRAAPLALHIVRRAFAGTLDGVDDAVEELRTIATLPAPPFTDRHVSVALTGGAARREAHSELVRRGLCAENVVDVAPAQILEEGLPFSRCNLAIILDASLTDVPDRYREGGNARKLVSVLCDAASGGGIVVAPVAEREIHEYARSQGCRLALFSLEEGTPMPDERPSTAASIDERPSAAASIVEGRIRIARPGGPPIDAGIVRADAPLAAQLAAALGAAVLEQRTSPGRVAR